MEKSRMFLKVTGIFMIIGGILAMLAGVIILLLGVILGFFDINDLKEVTSNIGRFAVLSYSISLLGGIMQVITGIAGIKVAKKPEKAEICIILGIITSIIFIVAQVMGTTDISVISHFDVIYMLLGLLVPVIYLISAIRLKTKFSVIKEIEEIIEKREVIYEIVFTFIICGIIGWAFETIEVWINHGTLTARGIFFISHIGEFPVPVIWGLPFIMMYGIGGALLIWCFKPLKNEPVKLFFVGMFVLTIFEYITSVICEYAWDLVLWDYSTVFLNFQGRICLTSSLAWGVLSVISVKVLSPLFHRLYGKIKYVGILHAILIILVVYITICYSLRHTLFPDMV